MKTPLEWLLEKDNPSVRYFALKHLLDRSDDDADVQAARRAIMRSEPIRKILAAQEPEGYWVKPGSAYWPSYRPTTWQVLFLAEPRHERTQSASAARLRVSAQARTSHSRRPVDTAEGGAERCDVLPLWELDLGADRVGL